MSTKNALSMCLISMILVLLIASCSSRSNVQNADALHDTEANIIESVSDSSPAEVDAHNANASQEQVDVAISEDTDETWKQGFAGSQHSVVEHGNISNYGLVAYYGDWIYFINTQDYNLYRTNKDGADMVKLDEGIPTSRLCVSEDSIYFNKEAIYKMDLDGSDKKMVCDKSECFEVEGDQIYYSSDNGIYKIGSDGSDNTLLHSDRAFNINVSNGWIYYNSCQDGMLYRLRTDGSLREIVCDDRIYQFVVSGDWIFYSCTLQGLYKIKVDGQEKSLFLDESIDAFNIDNDWIYYSCRNGLSRISIDENEKANLPTDKSIIAMGLAHDKIVIYYHLAGDCGESERVSIINKSWTSDMSLYSEGEQMYRDELIQSEQCCE